MHTSVKFALAENEWSYTKYTKLIMQQQTSFKPLGGGSFQRFIGLKQVYKELCVMF